MYLYIYFVIQKKNIWQESISSKVKNKESIYLIIKSILKVSIPMSLCALFSAFTKTIDAMTVVRVLKRIIGEVDTLIMLPFSFNIAFATVLVPTISSAFAKNQIEIAKRKIKFSFLLSLLIGIPCTVLMSTFSNNIIRILFPNANMGGEMLKISSWSIIFVLLTQTINGALQGMGRVNIPAIAYGIGSIIKLILNIILIPVFKINGAIYSTIISSIVIFLICFIELKKCIKINFIISYGQLRLKMKKIKMAKKTENTRL